MQKAKHSLATCFICFPAQVSIKNSMTKAWLTLSWSCLGNSKHLVKDREIQMFWSFPNPEQSVLVHSLNLNTARIQGGNLLGLEHCTPSSPTASRQLLRGTRTWHCVDWKNIYILPENIHNPCSSSSIRFSCKTGQPIGTSFCLRPPLALCQGPPLAPCYCSNQLNFK